MLSSQTRNWPGNVSWMGASVVLLIAAPKLPTRGNTVTGGHILPDSGRVQSITKGETCRWLSQKYNNVYWLTAGEVEDKDGTRSRTQPWIVKPAPGIHFQPQNPPPKRLCRPKTVTSWRPSVQAQEPVRASHIHTITTGRCGYTCLDFPFIHSSLLRSNSDTRQDWSHHSVTAVDEFLLSSFSVVVVCFVFKRQSFSV